MITAERGAHSYGRVSTRCHGANPAGAQSRVLIARGWGVQKICVLPRPGGLLSALWLVWASLVFLCVSCFSQKFFRLFISRPAALLEASGAAREPKKHIHCAAGPAAPGPF